MTAKKRPSPTLSDGIYQRLLSSVLAGAYVPGQVLRQEELAVRFSVSRVPLREAMGRLAADGLLVLRPRRGYAVTSLDRDEIRDIFDLRMVIEERAGRFAALARQTRDVDEVSAIMANLDRFATTKHRDQLRWFQFNREFHWRLFASSGRRQLCRIATQLRDTVEPYIRIEVGLTGDLAEAQKDHREIFHAFSRGDADKCAMLCREHCEHTANRLLAALRSRETSSELATDSSNYQLNVAGVGESPRSLAVERRRRLARER